jgi:purine-binding chemotaxis protein CheW
VDAVCDILKVTENMLQAAPDVGSPTPHDFVDGVMTTEAGIVGLLSLRNILPTLAERMAA